MSVPEYDNATNSLTIMALEGDISVIEMSMIHLTDPKDGYSLCDSHSAGWHVDTDSYNASDLNTTSI